MIGLHATQALLDPGDNVLRREHVRTAVAARRRRRADQAAAFAGEIILIAPMPDVAADALLAEPVIDRRVNVVDPGIEHCVEDRFGLGFTDVAGARRAAQLHRAVAEHRYLEAGGTLENAQAMAAHESPRGEKPRLGNTQFPCLIT